MFQDAFKALKTINMPLADKVPEDAKIIFHKNSKFPRHKLAITKYQRKIKENLADFLVGNYSKTDGKIGITYNKVFITENDILCTYDNDVTKENIEEIFNKTVIEVRQNESFVNLNREELLYVEYMLGKHTIPLITDELMNKLVDAHNDRITQEEVESIIDLLKTNDKDNVILGTKLLTQFNLNATPLFTKIFLTLYHDKIAHYPEAKNSVVYKNLIGQFPPGYKVICSIRNILNKTAPVDDEEKNMVQKLVLDFILPGIENRIKEDNETLKLIGLKLELNTLNV